MSIICLTLSTCPDACISWEQTVPVLERLREGVRARRARIRKGARGDFKANGVNGSNGVHSVDGAKGVNGVNGTKAVSDFTGVNGSA